MEVGAHGAARASIEIHTPKFRKKLQKRIGRNKADTIRLILSRFD